MNPTKHRHDSAASSRNASSHGEEYRLTVDLSVLDHLGVNLYSNIAAVLTEVVANAWDADAENVDISIDEANSRITIADDGDGMTVQDINSKYLRVGYRRREDDAQNAKLTAKGRMVMGRKGLGKLSLFSIADVIEIQSAKDGEVHGFRMSYAGIKESEGSDADYYSPEPLHDDVVTITKGTQIVLKEIKRQRLGRGATALRKRLARRFSVIGEKHDFRINIDERPVTAADRGDLPTVQFLWAFGDSEPDVSSTRNLQEQDRLPDRLEDWVEDWSVKGWIGTARRPKQLDSKDAGNLNSIVVFARGRLFHENILDKVNDGRLFTKYLTGQIEADFLDLDDERDIATSDRQRIQEDDPRYALLLTFLRSSLARIEKRWTEWRCKHELKKVKEKSPALTKWLESLPEGFEQQANSLIAKLSALPLDHEEDRKDLYRHGIYAFERMKLRGSTENLAVNITDVPKLLRILADRDVLEASLYREIVKSRLEVIRSFMKLIDENALERVLQESLFENLWLLDPAWERATASERMESRLTEKGVIIKDLTKKEEYARVDIAYRTYAGKHIIVELKRVGRQMALNELQNQGQTYVDKLKKILLEQNNASPNIEVVFVIGKPIPEEKDDPDRLKFSMLSVSPGSRIVHYDTLVMGAENAYSAYLAGRG